MLIAGKRDADFVRREVAEVEKMVAAENGLVRNACFFQDFADFPVQASVLAFPKRAEWILVGVAWFGGSFSGKRELRGIGYEVRIAVRATGETGAVFGVASGTKHKNCESTTEES